MREHWMGDIGDYAKFGLLCELHDAGFRPMGVVWYLVHGPGFKYLEDKRKQRFQSCNPGLYAKLNSLVGARQVISEILTCEILPKGTVTYDEPIPLTQSARQSWLNGAVEKVQGCELIFLDPDNGLVPSEKSKGMQRYVKDEELQKFLSLGKTLVLYQHLAPASQKTQANRLLERMKECCADRDVKIIKCPGRLFAAVSPVHAHHQIEEGISSFLLKFGTIGVEII